MNKRLPLLIIFLQAAIVGCSTSSKPAKPSVEQTKIAVPVPVVVKPTVVYTQQVRDVTSKLKIVPGQWKMIICHHSADESGNAAKYDIGHRQRGMVNGLAYHFVIGNGKDSGDGEIEIGMRWTKQLLGGHVRDKLGLNEIAIGICLVGNFENHKPTEKQVAALKELLLYLRDEVAFVPLEFKIHCEVDPGHTECPGKYFPTEEMRSLFIPALPPQPRPVTANKASPGSAAPRTAPARRSAK
ncbi:MAG: peptidoglycan recognition family protein [Nibricoccus sp.]